MAEGNDDLTLDDKSKDTKIDRTEDYKKLVDYGLDEKVASKLDEIYKTGINLTFHELDDAWRFIIAINLP